MMAVTCLFTLNMRLTLDPSLCWAGALVAALVCAVLCAKKSNFNARTVYWAGVLGLIFGMWGGHMLGIFYYGTDGRPWAWLRFWSGGQAQYGGLAAGTIAASLFLITRRVPFFLYADALIPSVALGVAIGRIGCFLNGDDFGSLSNQPWAIRFPAGTEAYADHFNRGWITPQDSVSLAVHPVQLYATAFWLGLFVALIAWKSTPGERLGIFAIGHGLGRYLEQLFRGDFQAVIGPFSLTQLLSLVVIFIGAGLLLFLRAGRQIPDAIAIGKHSSRSQPCKVL